MRLVLVLPYFKAGGTERQGRYIADHFREHGHDVHIVVFNREGSFSDHFDDHRVTNLGLAYKPRNMLFLLVRLMLTIIRIRPNVVLSRASNSNMLVSVACAMLRQKSVLFLSGPTNRNRFGIVGNYLRRASYRLATLIFSVSSEAAKNCITYYGAMPWRMRIVRNGVRVPADLCEMPSEYKDDGMKMRIVAVGSLRERKGFDILMRALKVLVDKGVSDGVKAYVLGSGESLASLTALASCLGVTDLIQFVGVKDDPTAYLQHADVFVLSSRAEGFPNALLEAMAVGLPVVSANCVSGPSEIIRHRDNGFLFEVEDHNTLAAYILELKSDEKLRNALGQSAYATIVSGYTITGQLDKMEKILVGM